MKKQPKNSPEVIERAVRILRLASAFFAQAEFGRHFKS